MQAPVLSTVAQQLLNQTLEVVFSYDGGDLESRLGFLYAQFEIRPAPVPHGHPDLKEKIKLFLDGKRLEGLSEKTTLKGYTIELRTFSKYINKATAEITTADIRDFLSRFSHLKQSSIAGKISVLKSFFGWLHMEEIIERDPTRKIKHPKKAMRLVKALNTEHFEMLREHCKTRRERAMIEMFYSTGCRLSELRELDRKDIDWQSLTVNVFGKGSKERKVYLSFKAVYHLKKYLNERKDDHPALFVTERKPHERLSTRGFQREIKAIALGSQIPKNVHPHILRHTFATDLLANGADIASVQALLGHSDPGTTQIYCQVTDERMKQVHKQYHAQ